MAVMLRLKRVGTKKKLFWRIVACDKRSPRDGKIIEQIGIYQPKNDPSTIVIKKERALYWLKNGATPSETVKQILKKQGIKLEK